RLVRAGLSEPRQGDPFAPGPVFAAPFHLQGDVESSDWSYARYGNPTWTRYEQTIGELEDAEVVLFASGLAAATALLLTNLSSGDAVAMDRDCYHGVRAIAQDAERFGIELRPAAPDGLAEAARGARLLWMESPSNPKLEVYDLEA